MRSFSIFTSNSKYPARAAFMPDCCPFAVSLFRWVVATTVAALPPIGYFHTICATRMRLRAIFCTLFLLPFLREPLLSQ